MRVSHNKLTTEGVICKNPSIKPSCFWEQVPNRQMPHNEFKESLRPCSSSAISDPNPNLRKPPNPPSPISSYALICRMASINCRANPSENPQLKTSMANPHLPRFVPSAIPAPSVWMLEDHTSLLFSLLRVNSLLFRFDCLLFSLFFVSLICL